MKRCPQCEFIYEDDQGVCDMDGTQLALDSRPLPNLQALYDDAVVLKTKRSWKGHTVPAFASLVLAAVLFLVYYVSIQHARHTTSTSRVSQAAQPTAPVTPSTTSVPATPPEEKTELDTSIERGADVSETAQDNKGISRVGKTGTHIATKESSDSKPNRREIHKPVRTSDRDVQEVRSMSTQKPSASTGPRSENTDKESKIGSILKKTGRLLKKPFRL